MEKDKIRVIMFDDSPEMRDSVGLLLGEETDMRLIAAFADCSDIKSALEYTLPDVIIMDIDMPGMNGIEAVKRVKMYAPECFVLMQTVFEDDDKVFSAIRAGADGYVLKNAPPEKLVASIREVLMGGAPMSPGVANKVMNRFQELLRVQPESNYNLSGREQEVLQMLVAGKSYKMISSEMGITYDTVRAHMKKIYTKLHVSSMTEAVAKALREGLV